MKKIKFLTKANIYEYVAEDQRPEIWGGVLSLGLTVVIFQGLPNHFDMIIGTDDWIYQWEDEEIIQDIQ